MEILVYYLKQTKMNPTKIIRFLLLFLFAAIIITSCKKDAQEELATDSSSVQQLSIDDGSVEDNMDEVLIDAGNVLSGSSLKTMGLPCNATLDSVWLDGDTMVHHITYDGLNCIQTKNRKGVMLVKMKNNTQWFLPGAFLRVELHDYEVTNVFTGNKVTINGNSSLENVSGGVIQLLGNGINTVIHKNTAHVFVSFNENPPKGWHLSKTLVYTGTPGELVLAMDGFGVAQGFDKLYSWGVDRDGKMFYAQISEAVVVKETCDWVAYSGEQIYNIPEDGITAIATYGYNSNNEPISGDECPTRYKLYWQQYGQSGTIFLPLNSK